MRTRFLKIILRNTLQTYKKFIYLNFASSDYSDSKSSKNSENNSIAEDIGNRREQIHLHVGTKT